MRERWAQAFTETARAYWTPERVQHLTRGKHLSVSPDTAPLLLRAIGLLHRDATMPPAQRRKFFQINHMVAVLGPPLRELAERNPVVRLLDAGCGRSYLTTLLAWHFRYNLEHPVQILGVDWSEAIVEESRRRTEIVGLDDILAYHRASLGDFDLDGVWREHFGAPPEPLHGVVSLHACDTATDDAIALAVARRATLIAVAPCCQAELARGWKARLDALGAFSALASNPHLRRQTAASLTDAFRMLLIRSAGYEAKALEFVASSHTPKNTLIRAMRRSEGRPEARAEYEALKEASGGVGIALEARI